jgi:hypothetical protein
MRHLNTDAGTTAKKSINKIRSYGVDSNGSEQIPIMEVCNNVWKSYQLSK